MVGKLYVVYESSFDKPREHMAKPDILLITLDKEKAYQKLLEEYKTRKEDYNYDYIENYNKDWSEFNFNKHYKNYSQIGIIEYESDTFLLELNSFINKYTDERIKNMARSQLIQVCYELILNDSDSLKLKQYTIKDIKDHLYILEGQKIDFKWCEEIPDESYNLPTTIYKTLTHFECYIVDNGILKNKICIGDERQWVKVNLETLNPDKLDGFYISFMDKIGKESIFSKLDKVKKELL